MAARPDRNETPPASLTAVVDGRAGSLHAVGMGAATVKATHAQLGLRAHDVFEADVAAAIAARASDAIAIITRAARGTSVAVEHELAVIEAIFAVAGAEGVRRRVARQVTLSADGPLLRPIRESAVRLFGPSPASLLRFFDAGWRSSFDGCGALSFESLTAKSGVLTYANARG